MKKNWFLVLILSTFVLSGCNSKSKTITQEENRLPKQGGESKMTENKKVLMVVAPVDFQEKEYQTPKTILKNSGYQIVTSAKGVKSAKSSAGTSITVNKLLEEINVDEFEAVIFVGGPGTTAYFNDQTALSLAKEAYQKGKVIGAICIAPSILANAGILKDKKATAFSSEAENLKAKGANYTGETTTVDGKIVTANGPTAAEEFGQKIVELLNKN